MSENQVTRRDLIKRTAYAGIGLTAATIGIGSGWRIVKGLLKKEDATNILAQRERERPQDNTHWFIPAEYALVTALAALIVPSDSNGPGASEAGVVDQVDRMLASSPQIQKVYAPGLVALDAMARRYHGRDFIHLQYVQQMQLLQLLDEARLIMEVEPLSVLQRAERKMNFWYYYRWLGISMPAADLFRRLIRDVTMRFYNSRIACDWLGYDGPPFPMGYIGRRENCSMQHS